MQHHRGSLLLENDWTMTSLVRCLQKRRLHILLIWIVQFLGCSVGLISSFTLFSTIERPPSPLAGQQNEDDELFSVAPMMGHTNRHYRYFWRIFSRHSTLYTEMIPASTIVQAYEQQARRLMDGRDNSYWHHPECIQQVLQQLRDESQTSFKYDNSLDALLRDDTHQGKITLQLGGRDPHTLATAAAIATAYQSHDASISPTYSGINLNCGCLSTSVASGRRTGAALMLEPHHVVECLNAMTKAMQHVGCASCHRTLPTVSVKHRLGVRDAENYQRRKQELLDTGRYSLQQEEQDAYQSCHDFVSQLVASPGCNHHVSRIQVHARLALLGLDNNDGDNDMTDTRDPASDGSKKLWVPTVDSSDGFEIPQKVNHQRVQYRAKQQARQATINNRRIPPLHPNIVPEIAREFPCLQVVTNGGIESLQDVQERMKERNVHGAMVGRAAINHPCAFAGVDATLFESKDGNNCCRTRRDILEQYIHYCAAQEEEFSETQRLETSKNARDEGVCGLRRALVAPAFHLMVGEDGNAGYQRLLKRLVGRPQRHSSAQMLQAAMAQVPSATLDKALEDHVAWNYVRQEFRKKHGEAASNVTKRSGALQRVIH